MRYARFELLVLVLGGGAIIGSMLAAAESAWQPTDVVAQLLLVVVLGAALHWGRNGGFATAVVAILIYVYMRLPLLMSQGFTSDLLMTMGARLFTYAVVAVVGGELFGRMKYLFARLDRSPLVDDTTGVFNARYAAAAIRSGVARWERYAAPYSVICLTMLPALLDDLSPQRRAAVLRQVANHIRNDIRLVDDVSHRGDGRFVVLFPNTDAVGAAVAGDRVQRGITELLDASESVVETAVLSCEADVERLLGMARDLDPDAAAEPMAPRDRHGSVPVDI